jgi:hypothetical protein
MKIQDVPHGLNVVIETNNSRVYIGRFDSTYGFLVIMHVCDVYEPPAGTDPEPYIRETAKYGGDVKERNLAFDAHTVTRWRALGDVPKE